MGNHDGMINNRTDCVYYCFLKHQDRVRKCNTVLEYLACYNGVLFVAVEVNDDLLYGDAVGPSIRLRIHKIVRRVEYQPEIENIKCNHVAKSKKVL